MLQRISRPRHVSICEGSKYVDDCVNFTYSTKELVAQTFPFGRTLNQPADIGELHRSGDNFLRSGHLCQLLQPVIEHLCYPDIGVRGRKRVWRSQSRTTCERVV